MPDTGFIIAGTGANDASYGTNDWINPTNVTADDGVEAEMTTDLEETNYLKGTNYGHAIPTGAAIDGIEVQWQWRAQNNGRRSDEDRTRLVDESGAIGATDRATGEINTTTATNYQRGGASDLWGDTWGETDVENSLFGFVHASRSFDVGSHHPYVDAMWTKIYYTEAAPFSIAPIAPETNPLIRL